MTPRRQDPGYLLIASGRRGVRAASSASAFRSRHWLAARLPAPPASPATSATDRAPHRAAPRAAARRARADRRRRRACCCCSRCSRSCPGVRCRPRAGEPRRHAALRPAAAARPRAARRRAAEPAHAGRRADAARRRAPRSRSRSSASRCTHLASPDGELRFALLSDWTDAADRERARRRRAARGGRRGHRAPEPPPRAARRAAPASSCSTAAGVWNAGEGTLDRLGAQARQAARAEPPAARRDRHDLPRRSAAAPPVVPAGVRYVITLDADTRLPRGAARRLVGTMAHPLNRPRLDPAQRPRRRGLRACSSRASRRRCRSAARARSFQRVFSGPGGIDPYASAVSDVYQDLFGEGSYTGKGIYDVDAFEAALAGRVPENALLSHDLFEGIFARAGLVSDIEVFEEFPARYDVAAARQHRWARGDWQLLPWILRRGRASQRAGAPRSRCSAAGRCSTTCGARCSAPAAFLALVGGLDAAARAPPRSGRAFVLATLALPALLPAARRASLPRRLGISKRSHLRARRRPISALALRRSAFAVDAARAPGLADDRRDRAHAAAACVVRRRPARVGDRRAGEARPAARTAPASTGGWPAASRWRSPARSLVACARPGALAASRRRSSSLWLLSPVVARLGQPAAAARRARRRSRPPTRARCAAIARRTWRFFETFVDAGGPHAPARQLPGGPEAGRRAPDLADEHRPLPALDGRRARLRLARHCSTPSSASRRRSRRWTRLERFRGHFYNWYDTRDLRPLEPQYVSSVDSGNLAGHLIALAQRVPRADRRARCSAPQWLAGIADALALARESLRALADDRRTQTVTRKQLDDALDARRRRARRAARGRPAGVARGSRSSRCTPTPLVDIARTLAAERGDDAGRRAARLGRGARARASASHARDLDDAAALGAPARADEPRWLPWLATMPTLARAAGPLRRRRSRVARARPRGGRDEPRAATR